MHSNPASRASRHGSEAIGLVDTTIRFDEETDRAYRAWQDQHSRHLICWALVFGALSYLINHMGDYTLTTNNIDALLRVRVSTSCILIGVACVMFLIKDISLTLIAILMAILTSVANTSIAQLLGSATDFWLVAAQAITALVFVMTVKRFHDLIFVATILFILPTTLELLSGDSPRSVMSESVLLATAAAGVVAIGYFVDQTQRTAFKLSRDLHHAATHDPLTDIPNRLRILEVLNEELCKHERYQRPVSVLAMDIDHFKFINDTQGHSAGDEVLKALTARINREIRDFDFFGRTGGEEFLVVLPETQLHDAEDLAKRLRQTVEELAVPWQDQTITCTMSIGVAELHQSDDMAALLNRADKALYRAKSKGRNRVEMEPAPVSKIEEPEWRG